VLPAAKVTPEIAAARGIQPGRDCRSPSGHSAFSDIDSLLDFVETIVFIGSGRLGCPKPLSWPWPWDAT
jgi:glutamate synthase domain-containing protein 2